MHYEPCWIETFPLDSLSNPYLEGDLDDHEGVGHRAVVVGRRYHPHAVRVPAQQEDGRERKEGALDDGLRGGKINRAGGPQISPPYKCIRTPFEIENTRAEGAETA